MRKKQKLEISELQKIRDKIKIKMILKLRRLTERTFAFSKQPDSLFENYKFVSSKIIKDATGHLKTFSRELSLDEMQEVELHELNEKF